MYFIYIYIQLKPICITVLRYYLYNQMMLHLLFNTLPTEIINYYT